MFSLFSTPNTPRDPLQAGQSVTGTIRSASQATGVPFTYLMQTAKRESNLDPQASAAGSSATGLFQFIEQTWLGLVKREGDQLGLSSQADAIQQDRAGRYVVNEPDVRRQILDMRKDPEISARLAGVFTRENQESLRSALGRTPSAGELYIAHFMGANGARELISQASTKPEGVAANSFPEAAASNRSIFYDGKGRARSNREVYAQLVSMHDREPPALSAAIAVSLPQEVASSRSPLAIASPAPARGLPDKTMTLPRPGSLGENVFHGLFRSGGEGSSASALRKTWAGFAESRLNKDAPSFYPRDARIDVASASSEEGGVVTDADTLLNQFVDAYPVVNAPQPPILPRSGESFTQSAVHLPMNLLAFIKNKR